LVYLQRSERVVTAGLACISALSLKSPSNVCIFYNNGVVWVIIDVIKDYIKCANVIQQASWAVRNLSVRNQNQSKCFIDNGIEALFNEALEYHSPEIKNDINAALRDLGLKVNLKERWTGKGHTLKYE
jgi:hypothetical protein